LAATDPFVLTVARGRLSMRLGLPEPTGPMLDHWLVLFQTAIDEARRVASEWRDSALPHASTRPSVWGRDETRF
jgi:anti-sigma factor ChrR (cupin superfamily)